jgi:hypothetical protein
MAAKHVCSSILVPDLEARIVLAGAGYGALLDHASRSHGGPVAAPL